MVLQIFQHYDMKKCVVYDLMATLDRLLTEAGVCFSNGAFVLDDPGHVIYDWLVREPKCGAYTRPGGLTHNVFMKSDAFRELHPKTSVRPLTNGLLAQKEITKSDLPQVCSKEKKRTVLFYAFEVAADGRRAQMLYMKFETFPFFHPRHALSAFRHYVLKQKKTKHDTPRRDESPAKKIKFNDHETMCRVDKCIDDYEWYDEYVRAGNEFYVPAGFTSELRKKYNKLLKQ